MRQYKISPFDSKKFVHSIEVTHPFVLNYPYPFEFQSLNAKLIVKHPRTLSPGDKRPSAFKFEASTTLALSFQVIYWQALSITYQGSRTRQGWSFVCFTNCQKMVIRYRRYRSFSF